MLRRNASSSLGVTGSLTQRSQSRGRSTGPGTGIPPLWLVYGYQTAIFVEPAQAAHYLAHVPRGTYVHFAVLRQQTVFGTVTMSGIDLASIQDSADRSQGLTYDRDHHLETEARSIRGSSWQYAALSPLFLFFPLVARSQAERYNKTGISSEGAMQYKHVPISDKLALAVPLGLSADAEARCIARHIAFVDLDKIAADMKNSLKMWEEGKTGCSAFPCA